MQGERGEICSKRETSCNDACCCTPSPACVIASVLQRDIFNFFFFLSPEHVHPASNGSWYFGVSSWIEQQVSPIFPNLVQREMFPSSSSSSSSFFFLSNYCEFVALSGESTRILSPTFPFENERETSWNFFWGEEVR